MGLKKSTGRGTRVQHSTGLEWDELQRAKKHYPAIKYSTGENAPVRHSTGTEFDYRVLASMMRGEEGEEPVAYTPPNTEDNPKLHGIPEKAQEDTTWLDLYLRKRVEAAKGGMREAQRVPEPQLGSKAVPREKAEEGEEKAPKEQFKPMDMDY